MEKEYIARIEGMANVIFEEKKQALEVKDLFDRIEAIESFVCTFVDKINESERMNRLLYNRSVYVGTICREVASLSLKTLKSTICLHQLSGVYIECRDDAMSDTTSDGVSVNNSKLGIEVSLKYLLLKTRYLLHDVNNMERNDEIMDNVRLLDTSLLEAKGQLKFFCLDCQSVTEKRKGMKKLVR